MVSYNQSHNRLLKLDHRDLRDRQELQEGQDHREGQGLREGQDLRDLREGEDLVGLKGLRDLRDLRDHREGKDQMDLRAHLVEVEANLQEDQGIVRRHLPRLSDETMVGTILQLGRLQCQ